MNLAGRCQICFPQRRTRIVYNNLTLTDLSTLKGLSLPENLTDSKVLSDHSRGDSKSPCE